MANNNEQNPDINSLKASFCRQHFPDLVRFLRNFDISNERANNNGNTENFNMHFLLQAYEHKEKRKQQTEEQYKSEISNLKGSCKWILNDVREDDVLLAIDEYIAITSQTHGLNKLLSKLFKVNLNANTDYLISNASKTGPALNYSFEDETTKSILEHFSIPVNDKKIGKQCEFFKNFISNSTGVSLKDNSDNGKKKYYSYVREHREEFQFVNAFSLLSSLRNWSSHESMGFLDNPDQTRNFYRFIIFTHIGIVYICRRIWKKYSDNLVHASSDYQKPKDFDNFTLKKEIIKINIAANDRTWTIDNCNYSVDQDVHTVESNKNEVSFEISAKKYQQIAIHFTCNGDSYDVPIVFNYYLWNPVVDIVINPPRDINYRFEGIAGGNENIENKIGEQYTHFAKLLEEAKGKFEEGNSKILSILGRLEPSLQSLRNLAKSNNDVLRSNIIQDVIGILNSAEKNILDKIDELNKNINKKQNKIENGLERLNENFIKNEEIGLSKNKKELLLYYPLGLGAIAIFLYVVLFQIMDVCNIDYSVLYLNNRILIKTIIIFVWILIGLIIHYLYGTTKYAVLSTPKVKIWGYLPFIGIIIISVIAFTYIPNKTINSLIENYDFSANNHLEGDNTKAAKLMEEYLHEKKPVDDEQLRIQLTKYYLDYANLKEMAIEITRPMREDVVKYPKGSLFAAEALYALGKEYRRVHDIIQQYRSTSNSIPAVINRLEGLMYCYDNQYYDRDLDKGITLLKRAADDQNDPKAQYYLGHIYSHILAYKNESALQDTLFNLITAIQYLHKSFKAEPKAALELGRIYTDLNMADSAKFYLEKAISSSNDSLFMEATFRMGLLLESMGQVNNKYLKEVKELKYKPALLHAAIQEKNHAGAIEYYEAMGRYNGHRYIPPIVFEYISKEDFTKALDTLRATRNNGGFNEDFIKGMKAMIVDKDSLRGLELMKNSASYGCKYAKMICLFRDMEKEIKEGLFDIGKLKELKDISVEINFANYLISNILLQKARTYDIIDENHIERTQESDSYYKEAEQYGLKLISKQHPVGALTLIDARLLGHHFDKDYKKQSWIISEAKKELSFQYLLLRMSPDKQFCIATGENMDRISNGHNIKRAEWNNSIHFSFWNDVAIANNYLTFICGQLANIEDVKNEDVEKLTEAALVLINDSSNLDLKTCLANRINGLKTNRAESFSNFINKLEQQYRDDPFKKGLFSISNYNLVKEGEPISIHFNWVMHKYDVDNQAILNEFSNIKDHYYDKPL